MDNVWLSADAIDAYAAQDDATVDLVAKAMAYALSPHAGTTRKLQKAARVYLDAANAVIAADKDRGLLSTD